QRAVYVAALEQLVDRQPQRPAVLVEPLRNFYPAEAHHQDYLINNPGGYCHVPIAAIANVKRRQKYVERIWDLTLEPSADT
ncbi:peptide-methionine (S)-S-oxide reductase, partial [Fusicatenibacter saccharivorans]|nr:peptide-methionine (S)-S-oxide reductase [Fusicatenibacter saccharivorans]